MFYNTLFTRVKGLPAPFVFTVHHYNQTEYSTWLCWFDVLGIILCILYFENGSLKE